MALALLLADYPDELAADLYETYGLDIGAAMDAGMEPGFVAALSVQLPPGCRWRCAHDPDAWWTGERMLLAGLLNDLRGLIWGMAPRAKRGPQPKPVGPSWAARAAARTVDAAAMTREELMRELAKPRREA